MRSGDTGSVEHGGGVRGHRRHGISARRHIAAAHAAVIERDGAVARGESGACAMPHVRRIAEPHDEQDGLARALLVGIRDGFIRDQVYESNPSLRP